MVIFDQKDCYVMLCAPVSNS